MMLTIEDRVLEKRMWRLIEDGILAVLSVDHEGVRKLRP